MQNLVFQPGFKLLLFDEKIMTIGLEAFVCIAKPKNNKSYNHKPERIL